MNNNAFVSDKNDVESLANGTTNGFVQQNGKSNANGVTGMESAESIAPQNSHQERENWGKSIEFLMSCIAMSVGLGNVWRFPFTALDNGGGAFLLPYLIVLFIIGRPLYYLEMVIGQFSSRNSINVYDISPFFRGKSCNTFKAAFFVWILIWVFFNFAGAGFGQLIAIFLLSTYYASIMALIGRYLFDSFQSPLPWTKCKESWANCIDPSGNITSGNFMSTLIANGSKPKLISSSEYYFK